MMRPITMIGAALAMTAALHATPSRAETPRDILAQAAFGDRDKAVALARIDRAQTAASTTLRGKPGDLEAATIQATALGYRAKLTGSRADAIGARKQFEALIARDARNPEAQAALGAWHVGVIAKLGRMMGRATVGAREAVGFAALDRSVTLGGNRAMFSGLAALLRLELDPTDPLGARLAEAASRSATPTALDHVMQRAAAAVLVPIRAGNRDATRKLAQQLLPFGRIGG